jgi:glucose-1-phosphate thymidylyltransferase
VKGSNGPELGFVLAAGAGRRTGYLGGILPKAMIPVAGRPLLFYSLQTLSKLGVRRAVVVTSGFSPLISKYLADTPPTKFGLATAQLRALRHATSGPLESLCQALPRHPPDFAVALGDDLTVSPGLPRLTEIFNSRNASVVQGVVVEKDTGALRRACRIEVDGVDRIRRIVEKPKHPLPGLRGIGIYLFRGCTFRGSMHQLTPRSSGSLSGFVGSQARAGRAFAPRLEGFNVNVNTIDDVINAWRRVRPPGRQLL